MLQGQITVKNTNGLYFFVDFKRVQILSILFVTRHENHKLHIYLKIEEWNSIPASYTPNNNASVFMYIYITT